MIRTIQMVNGDIVLDSVCNPIYVTDEIAVKQVVENTLSIFKGEYFRDSERGVNWLRILGKGYNRNGIMQEIVRALLKISYVTSVVDISLGVNPETRIGEIYYTVKAHNAIIQGVA